ncbi:hypothetical protein COB64_04560 [Candidatus Wolfebacteria bacterium]|nr:MAG: hypothetical protein COB64_04560 [Candidatus Wolfebacteria bacterium]
MNTEITIQQASPKEWDKITWLWPLEKQAEAQIRNEKKFKQISTGERIVILAEILDKVIGVVQLELVHPNPEMADGKTTAHIDGLRVDQKYRNQGIGKRLMAEVEKIAKEKGFRKIVLGFSKGLTHEFLSKFYSEQGYHFWKEKDDNMTSIFTKDISKL